MTMYSTRGIVLSCIGVGEADALFSIYTRDFGKITARAQGVKKGAAKLKGHLEPLNLCELQFVLGQTGARLTYAHLLDPWYNLRGNFDLLDEGVGIVKKIDRYCFPEDRDEKLWDFLHEHLTALDSPDFSSDKLPDFRRDFDSNFFTVIGYDGMTGVSNF